MLSAVLQFLASAAVIVVAGAFLARFADEIAEITGLGRLLIGSVLLAGATSLPELTVGITAVRLGEPDLAVGDLVGASLMNLLTLSILDLRFFARGKMLSRSAAGHALSGTMSIAMTSLAALGILTAPFLRPTVLAGQSLFSWLLLAAYVGGVRAVFIDQRMAARAAAEAAAESGQARPRMSLKAALAGFAAAASAIVIVGPWLASSANEIAELSGLGQSFVGTTFVAVSTALPELVTSLSALRLGAHDLVVGNVFGSNAFNMLLLVPLDLIHGGPLFASLSTAHALSCCAVILATTVAVMGQLYNAERRWPMIDPDAALVISIVLGGLLLVYAQTSGH